jgi:hypothetical protein
MSDSSSPKRRKRGPAPLVDDQTKDMVCRCLEIGLSRTATAGELGFSKATLCRAIQNDLDFQRRVLQAEVAYEKNRTLQLLRASERSWRIGVWLYQHYHPHRSTRALRKREATEGRADSRRAVRKRSPSE